MNPSEQFKKEVQENIKGLSTDKELQTLSREWCKDVARHKWAYNFRWMGRPAIQFPNDTWALQELIWDIKPDLIIETGIAHGGSLIYHASMLALLDVTEASRTDRVVIPKNTGRMVLGIDIDIRQHNKIAIEQHPMSPWIKMIEGSSITADVIAQVKKIANGYSRVLVCLDSNHTHDHVLSELNAYAPLVSPGSYCVVFDTIIEDMPEAISAGRPWGPGNNPKTAAHEFVRNHPEFQIDTDIHNKLLITVAPDGFLKRAED